MTIKNLSQLYYLNKEIKQAQHRLTELILSATDTSVKISGLPHLHGVSNKTAIAAQIADLRIGIEARIQLSIIEYNRLTRYIMGVDDCLVRQIIALRFVDGLKWRDVAQRVGGDNTDKGLYMALIRYLEKN